MKRITLCAFALVGTALAWAQPKMSWEEATQKADELISKLTLEEKCSMTRGYNRFFLPGVPEKGIPYVYMSDATAGVRINNKIPDKTMFEMPEKTTQMPAPLMLTATFNPELAYQYGHSVGEECRASGVDILLGPAMNIYRSSQCGRNFEYQGEDPFLAGEMVSGYVKGMQSTGTLACLKHFLCNNTEFYRRRQNVEVDERTIMEIYTPAFKAGIEAGAATVMTAYNKLNGEWCGQSRYVITDLLRGVLGFKGMVMSDWTSVYDWQKVIRSGQNVDMPGDDYYWFRKSIVDLVKEGALTEKDVEDAIRPLIACCLQWGIYERILSGKQYDRSLWAKMPEHVAVAEKVALEGTVLLKNTGILPMSSPKSIIVTGRWANKVPNGGGSAKVLGYDHLSLYQALKKQYPEAEIRKVDMHKTNRLDEYRKADIVIVATGTRDSESSERPFQLDKVDELHLRDVLRVNPNTIVVVNSGSGIDMSAWNDKAAAILYCWYPGQSGTRSVARILAGEVSPSGKLPISIEKSFADSPVQGNYLPEGASIEKAYGNPNEKMFLSWSYTTQYKEGVFVGYRWYEKKGIEPLYPFGFGLSYTKFELKDARITNKGKVKTITDAAPAHVSVTVENTGDMDGMEVVQLYVTENSPTVERPVKELKAFKKVLVEKGKKQIVTFEVKKSDLHFWDAEKHEWRVNPGEYTISVGTSSKDIAARIPVKVL